MLTTELASRSYSGNDTVYTLTMKYVHEGFTHDKLLTLTIDFAAKVGERGDAQTGAETESQSV